MFRKLRVLPAMLFAVLALVAVSCNTNDDPIDPNGTAPNAPTALMAQSRSATSVALKWDAPAGGVTPTGYRVYYSVTGQVTKDSVSVVGASTTTAVLEGLLEKTVYDFSVAALNSTVVGTATASVAWAPAHRAGIPTPLRIYSSQSLTFGSGLALFDVASPQVLKVAQGGLWDLSFDDKVWGTHLTPTISSPGLTGYVEVVGGKYVFINHNDQEAKIVIIGREYGTVNTLDDIWETQRLNDAVLVEEQALPLVSANAGGFGFVFASQDLSSGKFNYGKALVLRRNGVFIQGDSPDQYIELEVSYQTGDDVPYAVRAAVEAAALRSAQRSTPLAR